MRWKKGEKWVGCVEDYWVYWAAAVSIMMWSVLEENILVWRIDDTLHVHRHEYIRTTHVYFCLCLLTFPHFHLFQEVFAVI